MTVYDWFQLTGGVILALGYLPQIRQLLTTRSCKDLNINTYISLAAGIGMMEIYAYNLWVKHSAAPYWDIIKYSDVMYKASDVESRYGYNPMQFDLSRIQNWESFVEAMNYAMMKQFASLEKGGRMAVLIGDIKKKGKLYSMLSEIVKPGSLENIIIKTQHNCFSDNTTYSGSFIPILHEYVMIVRKDNSLIIPVIAVKQSVTDMRDIKEASWKDVIASVLEECNADVPLSYLYEQIENHEKTKSNKWWKEKIRQTLQCNPAHFLHTGRGMWKLNRSAA